MTIEQWEAHQAAARQRRIAGYASKFRAETVLVEPPVLVEPTDENLARIFANCVRPARPEDYDAIRQSLAGAGPRGSDS